MENGHRERWKRTLQKQIITQNKISWNRSENLYHSATQTQNHQFVCVCVCNILVQMCKIKSCDKNKLKKEGKTAFKTVKTVPVSSLNELGGGSKIQVH